MKKLMLVMLGLSLVAVSCEKKETQNNNTTADSANVSGASSDTMSTSGMPADTTAIVRDSMMNSNGSNQTNSSNQTNGNNRNNSTSSGGTRTDSAR